jgi:L-rhamnose mutarotase
VHAAIVHVTQRICFQLQVRPDRLDEYRERHAAVWPEMREALRAAGWRNYSLFLRDDGQLTGYVECDDFEAILRAMETTGVNARWQSEMAPFFEGLDGGRADEGMRPIPEIFHLD